MPPASGSVPGKRRLEGSRLRLAIVAALVVVSPSAALPCSCQPPGTTCQEVAGSSVVFIGVAGSSSSSPVTTPGFPMARTVSTTPFRIEETFKGGVSGTAAVMSEDAGRGAGSCGVSFSSGTRYLVFAGRAADATGSLWTSQCSQTRPFAGREDELLELRTVAAHLAAGKPCGTEDRLPLYLFDLRLPELVVDAAGVEAGIERGLWSRRLPQRELRLSKEGMELLGTTSTRLANHEIGHEEIPLSGARERLSGVRREIVRRLTLAAPLPPLSEDAGEPGPDAVHEVVDFVWQYAKLPPGVVSGLFVEREGRRAFEPRASFEARAWTVGPGRIVRFDLAVGVPDRDLALVLDIAAVAPWSGIRATPPPPIKLGSGRKVVKLARTDGAPLSVTGVEADVPALGVTVARADGTPELALEARTALLSFKGDATLTVRTDHPSLPVYKLSVSLDAPGQLEALPTALVWWGPPIALQPELQEPPIVSPCAGFYVAAPCGLLLKGKRAVAVAKVTSSAPELVAGVIPEAYSPQEQLVIIGPAPGAGERWPAEPRQVTVTLVLSGQIKGEIEIPITLLAEPPDLDWLLDADP